MTAITEFRWLEIAAEALLDGRRVPPVPAEWLGYGLKRVLNSDGSEPLEAILNIDRYQLHLYRLSRRNHHVREAWLSLGDDSTPDPKRTADLEEAIRSFDEKWPGYRHLPEPAESFSKVEAHLFAAFQLGPVPRSHKQLARICGHLPPH